VFYVCQPDIKRLTDKTFTPAAEVARMIIGRARVVENSSKYGLKLASKREAGFQGPPEISGAPFRLGDPESTQPDSDRAAPLLVLRATRLIGAARAGGAMQQYAVQLKQMPVGDDAAETV
jgi:hypothetical protein